MTLLIKINISMQYLCRLQTELESCQPEDPDVRRQIRSFQRSASGLLFNVGVSLNSELGGHLHGLLLPFGNGSCGHGKEPVQAATV